MFSPQILNNFLDIPRVPKPFLGLFRCGECGMMITAEQKLKYYKHTDHHASYTYYRCTKKSKKVKCDERYTRQELLDSQLSKMIGKVSLRQDWATEMLERLDVEKIELAHSCGAFVGEKREEIRAINQKLQRLLDSYLDQDVDRESYLTKKETLLSSKKTLEEQIARIQQTHHAWLEPMRKWINEAASAANIASRKDLEAKKVLFQKIFGSNLILSDQKASGDALIPWAALCAAPKFRTLELNTALSSNPSISLRTNLSKYITPACPPLEGVRFRTFSLKRTPWYFQLRIYLSIYSRFLLPKTTLYLLYSSHFSCLFKLCENPGVHQG